MLGLGMGAGMQLIGCIPAPSSSLGLHAPRPAPYPETHSCPPSHLLETLLHQPHSSAGVAGPRLLPVSALWTQHWCGRPKWSSCTSIAYAGPTQAASFSPRALLGLHLNFEGTVSYQISCGLSPNVRSGGFQTCNLSTCNFQKICQRCRFYGQNAISKLQPNPNLRCCNLATWPVL